MVKVSASACTSSHSRKKDAREVKRATVYRRKSKFLVHASCRTTAGVWILTPPCIALEQDCEDLILGQAVRTALGCSREGVPHPVAWAGLLTPLLDAAGVKSWSTFARSASCAEIEETDATIAIVPTRNLGADEGFRAEPDRAMEVEVDAVAVLGERVRRVLIDP
jgi:hypothetical protein